jgi:hypothetical protein
MKCRKYRSNFENYKIASSTWVTHLFKMNGINMPKGRIHHKADLRFSLRAQNVKNNQLRNITSFIVVLDPFERLLSAYTVRFNNIKICYLFNNCQDQDKMQRLYMKKPLSFPSFRNTQLTIAKISSGKKARPGLIPTFEEFIKFLVSIFKNQFDIMIM